MKKIIFIFLTLITNSSYSNSETVNVYVDMVADLFHYGHVKFLKQAKKLGGKNAKLIVGICSDEDVTGYKRKPILSTKERAKSVKGCKYVDKVIENAPLIVTKEIIEENNIHLVVHGDDFSEEKIKLYYGVPFEMGIFKTVPYTKTISTTDILNRVKKHLEDKEK